MAAKSEYSQAHLLWQLSLIYSTSSKDVIKWCC